MFFMLDDTALIQHYRPTLKKWGSICSVICGTVFCVAIVILLALSSLDLSRKVHVVYIEEYRSIAKTSDKFLSLALDTSVIANSFKHVNLNDPKFLKLLKALSPAYLRIGGTMADRLTFVLSNSIQFKHHVEGELDGGKCSYQRLVCDYLEKPNFTMNAYEWLKLNKFAREANLELIFDLNALLRFRNESWDYRNAEELIRFSNEQKLHLNWELGNEPNAFKHQFNHKVNPVQLSRDFHVLKQILMKYPRYAHSLVLGPDVTRPEVDHKESEKYLRKFLLDGASAVDAITWHQYYFNGATARIGDFLSVENFDILKWQIDAVKKIVETSSREQKPIWLGETSSAYGGGAPHLSNRFVASFLWLDKLGLAAKYGLNVVIRQSIIEGYYALINRDYSPTPDWWVSILYKKLVGPRVVNCHVTESAKVRLYCHSTKNGGYFKNTTSITVFGVNLKKHKARIRFEGLFPIDSDEFKNLDVYAYVLTTMNKLDSKHIYLNNHRLALTHTNDVPSLQPRVVKAFPYVQMPAFSLAFWVIPTKN